MAFFIVHFLLKTNQCIKMLEIKGGKNHENQKNDESFKMGHYHPNSGIFNILYYLVYQPKTVNAFS